MSGRAKANSTEADRWVARMDCGDWSEEDETQLQAWFAADPRRRGALLQSQASWLTLDKNIVQAAEMPARTLNRRVILAATGTALAASLTAGVLWLSSGSTYRTGIGEIRRVPLSDGSIATINTASVLSVNLHKRSRDIDLTAGEAWFQVAKNPDRPFVVQTGEIRVRAVGTAFSVRRVEGGAQILVTEGTVETWAVKADGHLARLAAGSRAFVGDNSKIRVDHADHEAVERALAWRSGSIDLSGESLADAVAEFNRYNDRQIVLTDSHLGGELFDGIFRTNDPQGFAVAVGASLHVPVDLGDPSTIRIGKRARIS